MEIVARVALFDANTRAILATVIDVRGSGYRLPGARMLILQNGETCGTVSGGCLETDVLERARKVLRTGKAEVFTYDTTADENSVFSLNMGCRGVIRILLEPIDRESGLNKLLSCVWHERRKRTLATYIGGDPGETVRVGERVFLSANNKITSGSKIADHGGFGEEDVHVALLVSNPRLSTLRIDDPVETRQIACTVAKALDIDCDGLQSQQTEHAKALPRKKANGSLNSLHSGRKK